MLLWKLVTAARNDMASPDDSVRPLITTVASSKGFAGEDDIGFTEWD